MARARSTVSLGVSLCVGIGAAWLLNTVLAPAHADTERVGSQLTLYRTRLAEGSQYSGYSYSNFTGADLRDFVLTVERRRMELKKGRNTIRLAGVPATIDRATVSLRSRTDPKGTKVLEQRFVFDLASSDSLLARAKGGEVQIRTISKATIAGTLLSYDQTQVTVRTNDKKFPVRIINRSAISQVELAKANRLVTEPTLEWVVTAERAGTHDFELSYRAHGMSWGADYTAIFDPSSGKVELAAYATIHNTTGSDFKDAKVRLVHRTMNVTNSGYGAVATVNNDADSTRVFNLHRPVNSRSGERVQLDLFPPISGRSARTVLVYEPITSTGYTGYPNTDCYSYSVQPTNDTSYRYLEIEPGDVKVAGSFPPGKARVFRKSGKKGGALELVSEENIQLDSDAKKIRIKVGSASSIKATRKQLDCRVDERAREMREKIELTVKNEGKKAVEMVLRENMTRWPTWSIESESETGKESGSKAQEYRLKIKSKGSKSLTYTVKYSW